MKQLMKHFKGKDVTITVKDIMGPDLQIMSVVGIAMYVDADFLYVGDGESEVYGAVRLSQIVSMALTDIVNPPDIAIPKGSLAQ